LPQFFLVGFPVQVIPPVLDQIRRLSVGSAIDGLVRINQMSPLSEVRADWLTYGPCGSLFRSCAGGGTA
jgi:hypothetical protein